MEWKLYIFGVLVVIIASIYYEKKVEKMLDGSEIIFSSSKRVHSLNIIYSVLKMIILFSVIFFVKTMLVKKSSVQDALIISIILSLLASRGVFIIYSSGVITGMKNYKYEDIESYKIDFHSSKELKLNLVINGKTKKIILRNKCKDKIINAFKGKIDGGVGFGYNKY
ncbi:hypothetical protein [Tepidibacter aestuarii]|uniref:hypothetical protein n=1 Tax=Tepidibacter aestuarii TaxID=2925782 RepID=UPI0020BE9BD7|nr:hypothetical protein [Tepidibacter aestuarii]CAH2212598.1 conserved membrane protein of unknown function [Tepidibacter aestuarii]